MRISFRQTKEKYFYPAVWDVEDKVLLLTVSVGIYISFDVFMLKLCSKHVEAQEYILQLNATRIN